MSTSATVETFKNLQHESRVHDVSALVHSSSENVAGQEPFRSGTRNK